MATTLVLKNCYGTYTASILKDDMTVDQVIEDLFVAVMLAAGYHPQSVMEAMEGVVENIVVIEDPQEVEEAETTVLVHENPQNKKMN